MNEKHWLLLKYLASNETVFVSYKEIAKEIKIHFKPGMDLINHLYQLHIKGLVDEDKKAKHHYRINQQGLSIANAKKKEESTFEEYQRLVFENEKLRNRELKLIKQNAHLETDLKKAQFELVELQKREIKSKVKWALIGAIGSSILTLSAEHAIDILRFLQLLPR